MNKRKKLEKKIMNKNKNKFAKKNSKSKYKLWNFYREINFQMNIK